MIILPDSPAPNAASPSLVDFGGVARPGLGGKLQRIDRKGARYVIEVSYPPMPSETVGRVFVSRLIRGKSEGIRIPFPLLGVDQGIPGAPVMNGAGQQGRNIVLRGLTPLYQVKEGYWLSIQDASGQHYLDNVAEDASATAGGLMSMKLSNALRVSFADGATVNLATPMIEGLVLGDEAAWSMSLAHHNSISFAIEESQ